MYISILMATLDNANTPFEMFGFYRNSVYQPYFQQGSKYRLKFLRQNTHSVVTYRYY